MNKKEFKANFLKEKKKGKRIILLDNECLYYPLLSDYLIFCLRNTYLSRIIKNFVIFDKNGFIKYKGNDFVDAISFLNSSDLKLYCIFDKERLNNYLENKN